MFALYKTLEDLGYDPYIIEYKMSFEYLEPDVEKRNRTSLTSVPYYIKEYIIKRGFSSFWLNFNKYIKHKLFYKKNFKRSNLSKSFDCVIVGSDEVFSLSAGWDPCMFGIGVKTKKLISYAPSFGQTTISDIVNSEHSSEIASGLKKFNCMSSRDNNTSRILKDLNISDVYNVCDPALLCNFGGSFKESKIPKDPYLLVYSYDRNMINDEEINSIKKFAKDNKLKTLSAGTYHKWCDYNIPYNCLEWLYAFENADYVITDTFHGCIASVITNRNFAVIVRDTINRNKLNDLISRININDRQVFDIKCDLNNILNKEPNYIEINKIIQEWKSSSYTYLKKALQG